MHNRLTAGLMIGVIAVAATGTGIAIGAAGHSGVKACSSNKSHQLGLLKHGKCATGFTKVTLGAQGPRGKQGPGATYQQQTVPNNDIQGTLEHDVAGIRVHATCGAAANVSLEIEPASGAGTIEAYGTRSQDTVINVVSLPGVANFSATGTTDAEMDLIARTGTGNFVDLRLNGLWANNTCTITEVAVPTKQAT